MAFKPLNDNETTPKSQTRNLGRKVSHGVNTVSPFHNLPVFSTPPSRTSKILNPFEPYLVDSLHLPTCSPGVFTQMSTPKTGRKFKWTIEDISHLKPADIDESTISQHVFGADDSLAESTAQKKIDTFFKETEIVPSPLTPRTESVSLTKKHNMLIEKKRLLHQSFQEVSTQTFLTLPPQLPEDLEKILKPYLMMGDNQTPSEPELFAGSEENIENSSLYKKLFGFCDDSASSKSHSPRNDEMPSFSSSPVKFTDSSLPDLHLHDSPLNSNLSPLSDCNISPISKNSTRHFSNNAQGSVFRMDFCTENNMAIGSTNFHYMEEQHLVLNDCTEVEINNDPSTGNKQSLDTSRSLDWSMEYKQMSFNSPSGSDSEKMEISFPNTPNSKLFTGIRKRLSESFKLEDQTNLNQCETNSGKKIFQDDTMFDAGYCTQEIFDSNNSN